MDLGMAYHTPPLKSKETRGNAITRPQSHPKFSPSVKISPIFTTC